MLERIIDMHMHSTYSDGELSPDELIELAVNNNISIASITDHDTINGIKNIDRENPYIKNNEIKIYNGIELSTKIPTGRMHILGYDFDINSEVLNNKLLDIRNNSISSFLSIIEQLKKDYNIIFAQEEIDYLIKVKNNLGRPDIARLLMKYGYVKTVAEAFDKYLIAAHNKVRGKTKGLSYEESIDLILKSGGIPVLAHPKTLELDHENLEILLKDMINCGLQGIEVYHSIHTKEEMNFYLKLANKYNLLISGGSDYHGRIVKPEIEIGTGQNNNLKIKQLSLVDEIKSRHSKR